MVYLNKGSDLMVRIVSAASECEEMYEYVGTSKTKIMHSVCGVTNPDPDYGVTRNYVNWFSIEYVIEGEGVVVEDDKVAHLEAGDFFILHPYKYHHYYSDKKNPWKKVWITFGYNTDYISDLLKLYGIEDRTFFKGLNNPVHLDELFNLFKQDRSDFNRELELLVFQLVMDLAYMSEKVENSDTELDEAKRYIDKRVASKLNVKNVADYIGVNYTYFSKSFKKKFGISPAKYIMQQKLELAKHLLENTDISVQAIADHLAFADRAHFSAVFSKTFGISAVNYRLKCRAENELSE